MRYPIPDLSPEEHYATSLEIERSRFLTWLCHAPSTAEFDALLNKARQQHPSASHHCSAFIAGPPGEQNAIGFSDDGEPGGTAGRPMYQVLEGSGLGQVGCVVIRYFGGIKLGTGGLARAYAQAVSDALVNLPRSEIVERNALRLQVDFAGEAETRHWCSEHDIPINTVEYDAQGVVLTLGWPRETPRDISALTARLKGRVRLLDPTE
ncbi:IMPACT family protein [Halomonas halocynthiae]|uniref:IMPACT family protein n=1 Tax=Halomonas halocynthiae TaxID=176290 RepID=UPI000425CF89|nr:YigZ family protein [Halomonas halocynthiae]